MIRGICLTLMFAPAVLGGCVASPDDSMRQAKEVNEEQPLSMSEETADFIVEMTDARMMDTAEGRLAVEHGTTAAIRDYGQLMIDDQAVMADELTSMAAEAELALPDTLSNEKSAVLQDLSELRGEAFDEEFIKTITLDHERDLEAFDEARDMEHEPVRAFVRDYRPMVEMHLREIQAIEQARSGGS